MVYNARRHWLKERALRASALLGYISTLEFLRTREKCDEERAETRITVEHQILY